ncbi:MAG: hypothetical protein HKN44_04450 [Ilumatobacter sp.]|nr:hypothetical protein [Ilumatobacter sp.]
MGIASEHLVRFAASRAEVWAALTRTDRYRSWWPWLRDFDGRGFDEGERWQCAVRPPLPYTLRFAITLTEVVTHEFVGARLDGDIVGHAQLGLHDAEHGCVLELVSDLHAAGGVAGFVGRYIPPLARFGHDWVIENGAQQFRAAELAPSAGDQVPE